MLAYCLVCSLLGEDRQSVRKGMQIVSEATHRHQIPVTWAVDSRTARSFTGQLAEGHEQSGDDVLLMLDIEPLLASENSPQDVRQLAQDQVRMREDFPPFIEAERDRLVKGLPWAEPTVAGAIRKNAALAPALEQVGFSGLWGYRWEQVEPEGAMDRGCPFGYFHIGKERHNGPSQEMTGVVGIPYASVDLVDVLRGRVPYDASAELVYALQRNTARIPLVLYERNARWNPHLTCVQHITAEHLALPETEQLADLLNEHLDFVCQLPGLECQTLAQSVQHYQAVAVDERRTAVLSQDERHGQLLFYDDACQLIFRQGAVSPQRLRNYLTAPFESRYCAEMELPELTRCEPSRQRAVLTFAFDIESQKEMPFGVSIWGDHSGLRLKQTDTGAVHRIGEHLLLVRMPLRMGMNQFQVELTI